MESVEGFKMSPIQISFPFGALLFHKIVFVTAIEQEK